MNKKQRSARDQRLRESAILMGDVARETMLPPSQRTSGATDEQLADLKMLLLDAHGFENMKRPESAREIRVALGRLAQGLHESALRDDLLKHAQAPAWGSEPEKRGSESGGRDLGGGVVWGGLALAGFLGGIAWEVVASPLTSVRIGMLMVLVLTVAAVAAGFVTVKQLRAGDGAPADGASDGGPGSAGDAS